MEVRSDPGIVCNFSGLVKGSVNIAGDDGRIKLVKLDVVFLGVGFVHENSACSGVKEDGVSTILFPSMVLLSMGKVMRIELLPISATNTEEIVMSSSDVGTDCSSKNPDPFPYPSITSPFRYHPYPPLSS